MKIAILTFSKAPNYGALLQTYALSKVLKDKGYEIKLMYSDLIDQISWKYKIRLMTVMYRFVSFRKKYLPSFIKLSYDPTIDLYIVGSDQVWNPALSVTPMNYFFYFLPQNARKVSYAASFGMDMWKYPDMITDIGECLKTFQSISVREASGVRICGEIFNVNASLVLDPTLLLNDYNELTGELFPTNTLISFQLGNHEEWNIVEEFLGDKLGLILKSINSNKAVSFLPSLRGFNRRYISVQAWVKSIAESEFVLTDSFHAMVFAILYKKQFVVLPSIKKRMGRVTSLLAELGIEDRYYESISDLINTNKWMALIDYSEVEKRKERLKKKSFSFLNSCLSI